MAILGREQRQPEPKGKRNTATHDLLIKRAAAWVARKKGCSIVLTGINPTGVAESPDVIGFRICPSENYPVEYPRSVVVEAKASRADFLRDNKKAHRQPGAPSMGQLRYYIAPKGLLSAADLPPHFGLLELRGERVFLIKEASPHIDAELKESLHNELITVVSAWNSSFYKGTKT